MKIYDKITIFIIFIYNKPIKLNISNQRNCYNVENHIVLLKMFLGISWLYDYEVE
jgi:hypothetical protein